MGLVITHPTGNEFFRAAVQGLYDAGKLQSVYTCLASFPGTALYQLGSYKPLRDIRRRSFDASIKDITHIYPWREAGRLLSMKAGAAKRLSKKNGMFSVDKVYQGLDQYVASNMKKEKAKGATTIYAYEDGALASFKKAKLLGMQAIYDLPIGYWRCMHELLAEENELNPGWAETLQGFKDAHDKLSKKDEEISLADTVIVASSFTAASLQFYKSNLPRICVVPYGFPAVQEKTYRHIGVNEPLKVLFVGGLSQRKGLSYLFDAVNSFGKNIFLTIVGRGNTKNVLPLQENLSRHRWIETLPHHEILSLMRENDVLVFPSLFEGFGQVITEAMAQGTPVITTERTAGPDIIQHGKNGWLVKAGSVNSLKEMLEKIITDPGMIEMIGRAALETARQRPWGLYGKEISELVDNATTKL
ncbi:MAG: glycosyltransferase family 4 protein [Bacteroidetes bacterium]|nr:glycosyltransferase family 4 protein [Bacteroidota bacterium]